MTPVWWLLFNAFVLSLLALDLGVFHRRAHEVKFREALGWSAVWISLALLFNLGLYTGWVGGYPEADHGQKALDFFTGYLIEKSLSVDNVFVFALLFAYFKVPLMYQHRVLFWGILGALVMRGALIFAGVSLIKNFHWVIYVFGAALIASGIKMWFSKDKSMEPEKNPVLRLVRRLIPVTPESHGQRLFVRVGGTLAATPLFVVLVFVEWSDLVFAVDSIPAILAITDDTFIIYTSNVMAMLGLRALYFTLSGVMGRFHLLHHGLSLILVFIGCKMMFADFLKVPTPVSLAIVASILIVSITASCLFPPKKPQPTVARRA